MKRLIFAAVMFFFSTVAFAFHCPADAKAIDAGLAKASLDSHRTRDTNGFWPTGVESRGSSANIVKIVQVSIFCTTVLYVDDSRVKKGTS